MDRVFFDFETRSEIDLKAVGAHRYANDPSTDVICLAWALNDEPVKIYRPLDGDPLPQELFAYIKSSHHFFAHNAPFEKLIWHYVLVKKYNWPPLPITQLFCTMAMAYAMGLQGRLEDASKCVGLKVEKDMKGNRVMLQLSRPRTIDKITGEVTWWERKDSTPALDINQKYEQVYSYCKQDIIVLRELFKRLMPLSAKERQLWLLDQRINDRGVYIDIYAAENAIAIAKSETMLLNERMRDLTNQDVSSCNAHTALRKWVNSHGVETDSVDKASVLALLENPEDLPSIVLDVLELRQDSARSSVKKIDRMVSSLDVGRSKGCFQYHGAASTGRWAGRRIQLQNMPRPELPQIAIEDILDRLGEAE